MCIHMILTYIQSLEMGSSTTLFLQVQIQQLSEFCKYHVKYHFCFSSTSFKYHSSTTCKIFGRISWVKFYNNISGKWQAATVQIIECYSKQFKITFQKHQRCKSFEDILDLLGRRTFPPTEKTLSTGEPDATTQNTFLINSAMQGRSLFCIDLKMIKRPNMKFIFEQLENCFSNASPQI